MLAVCVASLLSFQHNFLVSRVFSWSLVIQIGCIEYYVTGEAQYLDSDTIHIQRECANHTVH